MAKAVKENKHEILKPFRHEDDFDKVYHPGDDIVNVSETQLRRLAELGHVKLAEKNDEQ